MSAGRSASSLLFTLIATIILFAVFAGISSLNVLEQHAYMPTFGWEEPQLTKDTSPDALLRGDCAPRTTTSGFPFATNRQSEIENCSSATNPLAKYMNFALYFAIAAIISVAITESIRSRLP